MREGEGKTEKVEGKEVGRKVCVCGEGGGEGRWSGGKTFQFCAHMRLRWSYNLWPSNCRHETQSVCPLRTLTTLKWTTSHT